MGEQARANTHTYTHSVHPDTQGGWSLDQGSDAILTHVGVAPHYLNLWAMNMRGTHRGVGVAGNGKHTDPHSVPRDTQDGLTLGHGSDAVLTHVSVARPLFKSMVY